MFDQKCFKRNLKGKRDKKKNSVGFELITNR